jgi:hypothetical protein
MPIWWRLVFFPLWALAQSYAVYVYREPLGAKIGGMVGVLTISGIASAIWFVIMRAIADRFFGIRF